MDNPGIGGRTPARGRWFVVAPIFLTYVLMLVDRVNISIAGRPIMTEFGLSNVEMGTIFGSFVLGYALLQVPGGWLCDALGARRVLAVSIPSLTPLIAREYGWSSALHFAAAVALLGAVSWFGVRPDLPLWGEPPEPSPPGHGATAPLGRQLTSIGEKVRCHE